MIIDAYTFCWNEEVRLPYFLRLLSPMCRHIYIYDNGSTDKSRRNENFKKTSPESYAVHHWRGSWLKHR